MFIFFSIQYFKRVWLCLKQVCHRIKVSGSKQTLRCKARTRPIIWKIFIKINIKDVSIYQVTTEPWENETLVLKKDFFNSSTSFYCVQNKSLFLRCKVFSRNLRKFQVFSLLPGRWLIGWLEGEFQPVRFSECGRQSCQCPFLGSRVPGSPHQRGKAPGSPCPRGKAPGSSCQGSQTPGCSAQSRQALGPLGDFVGKSQRMCTGPGSFRRKLTDFYCGRRTFRAHCSSRKPQIVSWKWM